MGSRGSGNAFCAVACVALLGLMVAAEYANAAVVTVGGGGGWALGNSYGSLTVSRGDVLNFKYGASHNVYQVPANDYYSCQSSNPEAAYFSGNDYITLSSPGTYYFLCATGNHCSAGMKVAVTVV